MSEEKLAGMRGKKSERIKPVGALVFASFAEVHAPFAKVEEIEKKLGVDLRIDAPTLGEAFSFVLKELDSTFGDFVEKDAARFAARFASEKSTGFVETFSWKVKRTGVKSGIWEWVVYRSAEVPAKYGRLSQPNVFRIWVDPKKDVVDIDVLDKDAFTYDELRRRVEKLRKDWTQYVNAQRIRNAWAALVYRVNGVPWMPRGAKAAAFIPAEGLDEVEKFEAFVREIASYKASAYDFAIRSLDVYDREAIVDDLMRDVEDEVNRRLDELAEMCAQDVLSATDSARLESILERRLKVREKALGLKASYEDLLKAKVALRARLVEPKLLAEAKARLDGLGGRDALSPRAKALFNSLYPEEERSRDVTKVSKRLAKDEGEEKPLALPKTAKTSRLNAGDGGEGASA